MNFTGRSMPDVVILIVLIQFINGYMSIQIFFLESILHNSMYAYMYAGEPGTGVECRFQFYNLFT